MNALNVIAPYKYEGMWVFDDGRVGLVDEPFVGGADTIMDRLVEHISDADAGFTLTFSAGDFRARGAAEEPVCAGEGREPGCIDT